MANRCVDPFNIREAPAGSEAARRFPWWQTGVFRCGEERNNVVVAGDRFRFRPFGTLHDYADKSTPLFNNPFSWPIYITELRFLCVSMLEPDDVTPVPADYEDLGRRIGIKISTTTQGDILKEFVPMSALNTDPNVGQEMETAGAIITLPSDYFMPSDADFGANISIYNTTILSDDAQLQVGVRGCDPYNHSPVARFSDFQTVAYSVAKDGLEFRISGTAGGQSLRNMWMRDLTFAMDDVFNDNYGGSFWHQALLKVQPPQGPKWTTDIATPISCLSDQVSLHHSSSVNLGRRDTVISHKPVTPYLLLPQDRMDIEGTFYDALIYDQSAVPTTILATAQGYQEAPNVG